MPTSMMQFRLKTLFLWVIVLAPIGLASLSQGQVSKNKARPGTVEETFSDSKTGKSGKYTAQFPPAASRAGSRGLMIFFHGSGNTAGYASSFPLLAEVAQEFQLIPVALQAPNGAVTWANHVSGPSNRHDEYVKAFLDTVIFSKQKAVDRKRILFVGFSAGSTFLSGDFLPRFVGEYKGGAILFCGGGGPIVQNAETMKKLSPTQILNFSMQMLIQKKDFLYEQAMEGAAYWRFRGLKVNAETPEGGGHCAFDLAQELRKVIRKF